jgi:hypothetical protein
MRLFIATPCYRRIDPALAKQWAENVALSLKLDGTMLGVEDNCPWIDLAWETLVASFLASKCDAMLMREDDVHTPTFTVRRMLAAAEDHPVVVVPYAKRGLAGGKVEWVRRGTGLTLVRREVFDRVHAVHADLAYTAQGGRCHVGIFDPVYIDEGHGERRKLRTDEAFFLRLKASGFEPFELDKVETVHAGIAARFVRAEVGGP